MGETLVRISVYGPDSTERMEPALVLVDTGSALTALPRDLLANLGIQPYRTTAITTYDGRAINRDVGFAVIKYAGRPATVEVLFANPNDKLILGHLALQYMGLNVNTGTHDLDPRLILW